MNLKIVLHIIVVLSLVVSTVSAHPGKLDGNGGHTCKTNCEKWGLKDGEYHYHNRPIPASTPTPEPTIISTPSIEPTITSTPTPTPTPSPTSTPTPTIEPTITSTPTPKSTVTSSPTIEPTLTSTPTHEPNIVSIPTLEPTVENRFVNYTTVKPTDSQNQVIDNLNQTDKNISQGEEKKNWFDRLITWLFS